MDDQPAKENGDAPTEPQSKTDADVVADLGPPPPPTPPPLKPIQEINQPQVTGPPTMKRTNEERESDERKKQEEKLVMYKALAIKLKKELVKSREEYQKLSDQCNTECNDLKCKLNTLEETLRSERTQSTERCLSQEAKIKDLDEQLKDLTDDLETVRKEFDNYKTMASQMIQKNVNPSPDVNKTFEDERYKQLKSLTMDQKEQISKLESNLRASLEKNSDLVKEIATLREHIQTTQANYAKLKSEQSKCNILSNEVDALKSTLGQSQPKVKDPEPVEVAPDSGERDIGCFEKVAQSSPSASIRDDSQHNSNSSTDGSMSGYVHIKAQPFEIVSKSTMLEDAQNQIDNLTKAYLDSESTNSLLTEQIEALKEEIRRLQRGIERMDLVENFEFLKNVMLKYLTMDTNQVEQKQRLIPVISEVLKLSREETNRLSAATQ